MKITKKQTMAGAKAVASFLDERFPEGAMPGGRQLFAADALDSKFQHEAGCEALAVRVLRAALNA